MHVKLCKMDLKGKVPVAMFELNTTQNLKVVGSDTV